MSLLELTDLTVVLDSRPVVDRATARVNGGELVGLIGPNGSGKSSLMRAVLGLVQHNGTIRIGGHRLEQLSPRQRALHTAFLPQEREISWAVTVETLVALGRTPHRTVASGLSATDHEAIAAAMEQMDVVALADRIATQLSGGERARVLIARVLAQATPLVLADEPTAGLDPAHQIAVMETFADLARNGRGVLVSLHDLPLAARWCHRLLVLHHGRVVAEGAPAEVLTAARLAEVYGIRAHQAEVGGHLMVVPTGRTEPQHPG